jgi:hypothetical protein
MRMRTFVSWLFTIVLYFSCTGQDKQSLVTSSRIKLISVVSRIECKPKRGKVMIKDVDSLSMFNDLRKLDSLVDKNTLRVGQIGKNQFGFNEIILTYTDGEEENLLMLFTVFNGVLFEKKDGEYFINDHLAMLVENFIVQ